MTIVLMFAALAMAPGAAPPAPVVQAASSDRELVEAVKSLNAAMQEGGEAATALGPITRDLLASARSPAEAQAAAAKLRPLFADLRARIAGSVAKIRAVPPVAFPPGMLVDFAQIRRDALTQNEALLNLLDASDQLLVALIKKDMATVRSSAAKLARGATVLVAAQRNIIRGRQAEVAPTDSSHQALGLSANMYDALSAAFSVTFGDPGAGEAAAAAFKRLALDSRALGRAGRANMERELRELGNEPEAARSGLRTVIELERRTFALGDRMADMLDGYSAAPLTKEQAITVRHRLIELEDGFSRVTSEQVGALPAG